MKTIVEYVWIDGTKPTSLLRSKTKIVDTGNKLPHDASDFSEWIFDGSSTNQADGNESDRLLRPVCFIVDPIREGGEYEYVDGGVSYSGTHDNYIVLCEVFYPDGRPHESNYRARLREVLDAGANTVISWFGFEQEHTLFKKGRPYGFPESGYPAPQGPYYCGVGAREVHGREIVEDHMFACLRADLNMTGINAEVMPGQWEFQIGGPGSGPLVSSDHLWLARWLLYRIGEDYGVNATLDPKPAKGNWNGAGMHTNFSTEAMRRAKPELVDDEVVGIEAIKAACDAIGKKITEHLVEYGDGIESRLTGKHETARYDQFSYGVSDRIASIRIPSHVAKAGCGYLEDRRPNANADPYRVATIMLKTVCGL